MIESAPDNAEPLTTEEKKWLKQLEKVFNKCPSSRLGCYTIGGAALTFFDNEMTYLCEDGDVCDGKAEVAGIELASINTKINIDGVSG